jgi:hypothetical protein
LISLFLLGLGLFFSQELDTKDAVSLLSTIISAVALIWLVFGYWGQAALAKNQMDSLAIQRDELKALEHGVKVQQKELGSLSESLFLMRLERMMSSARDDYDKYIENKNPLDLILLDAELNNIFKSTDYNVVLSACRKWNSDKIPYLKFLKTIRYGAVLYLNFKNMNFDNSELCKSDIIFLYVNQPYIQNIPYVSECLDLVYFSVFMNSGLIDVVSLVELSFLSATFFVNNELLKDGAIEGVAAKFTESQYPAIYKRYLGEKDFFNVPKARGIKIS